MKDSQIEDLKAAFREKKAASIKYSKPIKEPKYFSVPEPKLLWQGWQEMRLMRLSEM